MSREEVKTITFALKLSFWLARPFTILEMINELLLLNLPHPITLGNALFCLIKLGAWKLAAEQLQEISEQEKFAASFKRTEQLLRLAINSNQTSLETAVDDFIDLPEVNESHFDEKIFLYLIDQALDKNQTDCVHKLLRHYENRPLSAETKEKAQQGKIWALLLEKNWKAAGEIFQSYSIEHLSQETTLLHLLYGCWLSVIESQEIANIHFSGVFDVPYPRTWTLFSHHKKDHLFEETWLKKSFLWERRQLYRQLALFYHCIGNDQKSLNYRHLAEKEVVI